jgi:hypothetical protein
VCVGVFTTASKTDAAIRREGSFLAAKRDRWMKHEQVKDHLALIDVQHIFRTWPSIDPPTAVGGVAFRNYVAMKIPYSLARQSLTLPTGDKIVVYDISSAESSADCGDVMRNVFRIGRDGIPRWRIQPLPLPAPRAFLEVYLTVDGKLVAYNADSFEYDVDLDTGVAKPVAFLK